jgi:hypothetical protein
MVDVGVGLNVPISSNDGPWLGNLPQVVAQQVHNHGQLCTLFWAGFKFRGQSGIGLLVCGSGTRALNGLG